MRFGIAASTIACTFALVACGGSGAITASGSESETGGDGDGDPGGLATAISVGGYHTCVLMDGGAVRCWGDGAMVGYGIYPDNIGDDESPASAGNVDIGGTVLQVAAGFEHTCALLEGGIVRCWGYGPCLGCASTGSIGVTESPASAGDVDVGGEVVRVETGDYHTCALLETGAVRCWGQGFYGELGYGNTDDIGDNETPASVGDVDVGGSVVQLALGGGHTCALLESGGVRCWGDGFGGQLGYGNTESVGDDETPASAGDVNVGAPVVRLTAGMDFTCALTDTGAVRCWGGGGRSETIADTAPYGSLGQGNTDVIGDDEPPASVGFVDVGGPVLDVVAGSVHTCALLEGGTVRCWGSGILGYGNTDNIGDDETPASAGDVDVGMVVQLGAGSEHTCVILQGGAIRCWGTGWSGKLGYGNTNDIGDDETPASAGDVPYI